MASKISPDAAGLNPAWRDAAVHSVVGVTWLEGTTESDIDAMRTRLKNETAQLRALAPESGCYFNEVRRNKLFCDWDSDMCADTAVCVGLAIRTGS